MDYKDVVDIEIEYLLKLKEEYEYDLKYKDYWYNWTVNTYYFLEVIEREIKKRIKKEMRETQRFLNWFNKPATPLTEDGIIGRMSNEQISVAIPALKSRVEEAGLVWDNEFMFIGIRTDYDFDNTFEDWWVIIAYGTMVAVPASTTAGLQAIPKYANLWIRGRQGVGTIKENQQIDYLLVQPNRTNAWSMWTGGLGFLFQDKPISVYRGAIWDTDKWIINTSNVVHNDIGGGFNVHSWANWFITWVSNLSEGCQVVQANYWAVVFPILVKNAKNNILA